jgi:membrane protein
VKFLSRWRARLFFRDHAELRGLRGLLIRAVRVIVLAAGELRRDFCFERAASLTFTSILSLIPLAVLFVSFAGSLGGGQKIIDYVKEKVFPLVAPEFASDLEAWLDVYISQRAFKEGPTGLVNLAAILGLLFSALAILVTAERVFNRIWKVPGRRSYFQKLSAFWVILTTSPFLIVASIGIGDFLNRPGGVLEVLAKEYLFLRALYDILVPFIVGFFAFTLLYLFLPSTRVELKSAVIAAAAAAVLWELSKRGFYYYVVRVGTVTSFYKQIATIPLFLVWLYVTWLITLWGGELSYAHQNLQLLSRRRHEVGGRSTPPELAALALLVRLDELFESGRGSTALQELGRELDVSPALLERVAERLQEAGVLAEDARAPGSYLLARHPRRILIREAVELFESEAASGAGGNLPPAGGLSEPAALARLRRLLGEARGAYLGALGDTSLEDLRAGSTTSGGSVSQRERA